MTRLPLASRREVQPYSAGFVDALQSYCEQISSAARQNKHHDHRRNLLINFLRVGLALDPVEFELEHKIKAHSVRGRIDAFFRELIIEIKTDLGRERQDAERELKKYFESQPTPDDFVGLVTDGISFEVYIYEAENVQQIGTFVLQADDPGGAFRCLDQLFFTAKRLPPTPEDIVERFGLHSATFNATRRSLLGAFSSVEDDSAVRVKFKEWNGLLAKVYGSEVGDEGLFITHTYLALLSRAIVTLALFAKDKRSNEMYRGLVDGAFFRKRRLNNLAEPDFFSWALDTPAESILIEIIGKLFTCLEVYDFRHLQGDILKELYQGLVDPQSRHDLGEYYTPDWLAELTLETIGYRGGRLLDPACGSGSFLYAAARRLRDETRLTSGMLVQVALESLIGIDVHPVAVLMTKANLLLSLREEIPSFYGEINLQVYMADTLMTGEDSKKRSLSVPVSEKQEVFHIPFSTVERGVKFLDPLIDKLCEFSERGSSSEEKENVAFSGWKAQLVKAELSENEEFLWQSNFRLLVKLEREKRNTVWAYILKNAYRPSYLRHDKVDYIVGNPPWLAYGYIQNEAYKKRVKELTFEHGILDAKDRKVFTRMDTSTLFFAHCSRDFLKDNGTIAFVMPKAAVLPAKQHLKFQRIGFSKILDFAAVKPLFNVPSCVLIRDLAAVNSDIPTTAYAADLHTKRNLSLLSVSGTLTVKHSYHSFAPSDLAYSPYHALFFQGATLVPRSLWFVEKPPGVDIDREKPFLRTSREAHRNAKKPWTMEVEGRIEREFLFGTVLAGHLAPFSIHEMSLVVLPVVVRRCNKIEMVNSEIALSGGFVGAYDWFQRAETIWEKGRKTASHGVEEWLNYDSKLTNQPYETPYWVLYNQSGTNISAAVVAREEDRQIDGLPICGLVVDSKCYWFATDSEAEADYLTGFLNSDTVNAAIKPLQTQGQRGERDIHRRPFEACCIPIFNKADPRHMEVAAIAKKCRRRLLPLVPKMRASAARLRAQARHLVAEELSRIDELVLEILEVSMPAQARKGDSNEKQSRLFS